MKLQLPDRAAGNAFGSSCDQTTAAAVGFRELRAARLDDRRSCSTGSSAGDHRSIPSFVTGVAVGVLARICFVSLEERPACRTLRALHRLIESRTQDFSGLLIRARRGNEEREDLLACTADLGVLFAAAADLEEQELYPVIDRWAGGSLVRAQRELLTLRMHLTMFQRAVVRTILAPPNAAAERDHARQLGDELVAAFQQYLGTEGGEIFRLADEHLDSKQGLAIDAKVRVELARRLPGRDPAWSA